MAYLTAFEKNYTNLVKALPMGNLYPYLLTRGLMRNVELSEAINADRTDTGKTRIYLDSIKPGIAKGVKETFDEFIKAMEDFVTDTNDATVKSLLSDIAMT